MNELILNEIRSLCDSFDETDSMYVKGQILTTIDYIRYTLKDDPEMNKIYKEIHRKLDAASYQFVGYLLSKQATLYQFMDENNDFFNENIKIYHQNEPFDFNRLAPLSDENVSYILEEFLKQTDKGLLTFYKKMRDEGRILIGSINQTFFTTVNESNTVISVQELKDLKDIMVFVHELGHAYYFYLNGEIMPNRDIIDVEIREEIPARIIEKKFVDFMYQNGVIDQATILNNMYDCVTYTHDKNREQFDSIKYVIATHIADNIGIKTNITNYFKYIHDKDIFELIKENKDKKGKRKVLM